MPTPSLGNPAQRITADHDRQALTTGDGTMITHTITLIWLRQLLAVGLTAAEGGEHGGGVDVHAVRRDEAVTHGPGVDFANPE